MDDKKEVSHAVVAVEGRAAWMTAWDAAWAAADHAAIDIAKLLKSRSEGRTAWAAVMLAARELTQPPDSNEAVQIAWAAAWDAAITASGTSLENRYQKKTVYSPPVTRAAVWDTAWAEAIEAAAALLDKGNVTWNTPWNTAIQAARSVLEKNKAKGLPPLADQAVGDAAWAVVCCAADNPEWDAAWDKALEAARSVLDRRDAVWRVDWDASWAATIKAGVAVLEKVCAEDSNPSQAGRLAWDAAWMAAGNAAWVAASGGGECAAWNLAAAAAKAVLEQSRDEWDVSPPPKWNREGRSRRAKAGRIAGAGAWNAAYRAEVNKHL